jgi:hypothetical protein
MSLVSIIASVAIIAMIIWLATIVLIQKASKAECGFKSEINNNLI